MVLDGHIHVSKASGDRQALAEGLGRAGMAGGLLISPPPRSFADGGSVAGASPEERLGILAWWQEASPRLYGAYWIDPTEEDADRQVDLAVEAGVSAFKVICDHYYPSDPRVLRICAQIAARGKPVLFHCGILWDLRPSAVYNRPGEFEALMDVPRLRFSLAHIGWPWCEELLAVYGKIAWVRQHRQGHAEALAEMFIDTTPGTPRVRREAMLRMVFEIGYDLAGNVIFGSDNLAENYDAENARQWLERDWRILGELNLPEATLTGVFGANLERFLGLR